MSSEQRTSEELFASLLDVLDLSKLDDNVFSGASMQLGWARIYGGQVVAQSLMAAHRTVPDNRFVHSLHCYFLRPGNPDIEIRFEVDRIRDGGSFTTRRVVALQKNIAIFSLSASFKRDETGMEHQFPMPDVPMPEDLPSIEDMIAGPLAHVPDQFKTYSTRRRPFELRPIDYTHYTKKTPLPPYQTVWLRATSRGQDDPALKNRVLSTIVLAYLSDMTLLDTTLFAHGRSMFDSDLQMASLDHAMWFHRPVDISDWLLYVQESPASSNGNGTARGQIFTRGGKLIASVAQEGLIRQRG